MLSWPIFDTSKLKSINKYSYSPKDFNELDISENSYNLSMKLNLFNINSSFLNISVMKGGDTFIKSADYRLLAAIL